MSYITEITDHVAKALAHLPSHHALSTNLRLLIELIADQVQELEDVVDDCYSERLLSTAVGVQLDAYGKLLAFDRNGLDDEDYRDVLEVVIMANRGSGSIPVILDVVATILSSYLDQGVRYLPLYPAGYSIGYVLDVSTPDVSDGLRAALLQLMLDMRPAGVSMELRETTEEAPEGGVYFTWDTDSSANAGGFTHTPPALWNTRVLSPITSEWPFPEIDLIAVYAMADRASWVAENPTDATDQATWQAASMSPDGAAELTKADSTGPEYTRLGGTVERGDLLHIVADAEPYELDDSTTWFDGQFTLHVRMKMTVVDMTLDGVITQWDPVGSGRCGLFVNIASGLYWYEDPAGIVVSVTPDTDWHTVTIVRDATNVTLYVDGIQEDQAAHGDVDALNGESPLVGAASATNGSTTGPSFQYALDGRWSLLAIYSSAQSTLELSDTWDAIDALDGAIG